MVELKTKKNNQSVTLFIKGIQDADRRKDCEELIVLMAKATKAEPKMWGDSIVGFGDLHYVYATGREGDWFLIGFSPRKQNLTLYFMCDLKKQLSLAKTKGKFKTSKSCLYLNRLADIERSAIINLIKSTIAFNAAKAEQTNQTPSTKKKIVTKQA